MHNEQHREAFGQEIRSRREEVDLTQAQVGQLAGVHRVTVRAIETGKPAEPRNIANIKRVLGCSQATHYATRIDSQRGKETPYPVLSARVAGIIGRGLLAMPDDIRPAAVRDYFDVIQAITDRRNLEPGEQPLPVGEGFTQWRDRLRIYVPEVDMRTVELELHDKLGVETPDPPTFDSDAAKQLLDRAFGWDPASGRPATVQAGVGMLAPGRTGTSPELHLIATSGLPPAAQAVLFTHLGRRREQLESALLAEITAMVEALQQASKPA